MSWSGIAVFTILGLLSIVIALLSVPGILAWVEVLLPDKRKVTVAVNFGNPGSWFDYPDDLPIPHKDDIIVLDENKGVVDHVKHVTRGNVSELKIICTKVSPD